MAARAKKFLSYYKPYVGLLSLDLACATLVAGIALIFPLCVRYMTNVILETPLENTLNQLYILGGVMFSLVVLHTLCTIFVDYQGHMMGTYMERDMRAELFAHYQTLSCSFFDDQRTGQLMTRVSNDLEMLSELYHHGPEDVLIASLKFFGTFAILITINVELTLVLFALLPFVLIYSLYTNKRLQQSFKTNRDRMGDINAQTEDSLAGIRVVQSFTNEALEQRKFAHANERFVDSRRGVYKSELYFYNPLEALTLLLPVIVIVFGGTRIVSGVLDVADLLTYVLYVGVLIEPIQRYVNVARLYQAGMSGFHRFMEMLEVQPDIVDDADAVTLEHLRDSISFDTVSFRYKPNLNDVFKNLSFTVNAGEYVALVGTSGVGKTTLSMLIPRFYDVTSGSISVDGVDIRQLSLESLRQAIGMVQQDVYLFAGTVAENICYGKPRASRADVVSAAKHAHAHDFICKLPNGYGTDIGQRGVKLSGGQKQRLSIARVFLKNPPIIIFDEATSSLDNESEQAVQAALETLSNNHTTIVIAHRLSTIRNAQRIIVLNEHGIAEQGSHDELMALGRRYAKLYTTQLRI
ncbi:MAG: ABC transporter ATP-binding protein [Deinococcota bacterium]